MKDCGTAQCTCTRFGTAISYNYESYFLNADHTNDVNRITNALRNKYKLRTAEQVNSDPFSTPSPMFVLTSPTLNQFCLKYDWSHESYFFYDKASACTQSRDSLNYLTCLSNAAAELATADALKKVEIELRCNIRSFYKCDREIRLLLAMDEIARSPQLIKGSLYDYSLYIAGLNASNRITAPFLVLFLLSTLFFIKF